MRIGQADYNFWGVCTDNFYRRFDYRNNVYNIFPLGVEKKELVNDNENKEKYTKLDYVVRTGNLQLISWWKILTWWVKKKKKRIVGITTS